MPLGDHLLVDRVRDADQEWPRRRPEQDSKYRRFGIADEGPEGRSQYRTILIHDIEKFSAKHRSDAIRLLLRSTLRQLMITALNNSGIDDTQYMKGTTGDGWLVTIDPTVGKPWILGPVMDHLEAGLEEHNRKIEAAEQMRVRLVLHAGDVLLDEDGHFGNEVNFAFGCWMPRNLMLMVA